MARQKDVMAEYCVGCTNLIEEDGKYSCAALALAIARQMAANGNCGKRNKPVSVDHRTGETQN